VKTYREQMDDAARRILITALAAYPTVTAAAAALGLKRVYMHELMVRYGVSHPTPADLRMRRDRWRAEIGL